MIYSACCKHGAGYVSIGQISCVGTVYTIFGPSGAIGGGEYLCALHTKHATFALHPSCGGEGESLCSPSSFGGLCPGHTVSFFAVHTHFERVVATRHTVQSINMERTCLCQIHCCGGAEDCVGLIEQTHQACHATHRKRLWLDTAQICAEWERVLVVNGVALLIDGESIVNTSDILHITAIFFAICSAFM